LEVFNFRVLNFMSQKSEKVYRCPLCGFKFGEEDLEKCFVCPLAKMCNMVSCPVCGYEFPKMSIKKGEKH